MTADHQMLREVLEGGLDEVEDLDPRSAVAIRAGGRMIGSIWVDHPVTPLGGEALHALTEAARIAAPHVIQARAARDVERRIRGEMLLAVLEGRASTEENATRLGFSATARFAVLAFSAAAREEIDQFERERLVDLVGVYCEALHGPSGAIAIGENVYALLQVDDRPERDRVVRVARETQGHAGARIGGGILAGVSSTVDSIREVSRLRDGRRSGCSWCSAPLGARRHSPTIDDVRSQVVLLELKELTVEHSGLTRGKLTAVLEHDAERGTQYAPDAAGVPGRDGRRGRRGEEDLGAPEHVPLSAAGGSASSSTRSEERRRAPGARAAVPAVRRRRPVMLGRTAARSRPRS